MRSCLFDPVRLSASFQPTFMVKIHVIDSQGNNLRGHARHTDASTGTRLMGEDSGETQHLEVNRGADMAIMLFNRQ